jgi:hypothetical protein
MKLLAIFCFGLALLSAPCWAQALHPELRGLLASENFQGQPVKGVYFFAGNGDNSNPFYTSHPLLLDDLQWNNEPRTQALVMGRIAAAHANTVVMSYWSNMPQWSPMAVTVQNGLTVPAPEILGAILNMPLTIMPALESGSSPDPKVPQWRFQSDFPHPAGNVAWAPGLMQRVGWLLSAFQNHMNRWAQVYDRNGEARYAINIVHACSDEQGIDDAGFAAAFGAVATQIQARYKIKIGFTLDTIGQTCGYIASPKKAGPLLNAQPAVLAVMGFEAEVFSGKLVPHDNNRSNLANLAAWKRAAMNDWVATGVPVILDVSNGYDGHLIFGNSPGSFWGDNLLATDDRWRNWVSELKNPGIKGIVMDCWNGYTESYAAVPTREHGFTVYNWLTDLLEPDPRTCSHMHYVNGVRTFRVYGAICDKWVQLGGDLAYGRPLSNEQPSAHGRVSKFDSGKAIYWSVSTNAHELHGLIDKAYSDAGADASCLGLPISDEEPNGGGRINRFEHGTITWNPGDADGAVHCK